MNGQLLYSIVLIFPVSHTMHASQTQNSEITQPLGLAAIQKWPELCSAIFLLGTQPER